LDKQPDVFLNQCVGLARTCRRFINDKVHEVND
jgi:hypothetical protein